MCRESGINQDTRYLDFFPWELRIFTRERVQRAVSGRARRTICARRPFIYHLAAPLIRAEHSGAVER